MIGEMRHRVTVQREDGTLDSGGFSTDLKIDVCTVWAKIVPTFTDEQWQADQKRPEGTFRITIRNRTDVFADYTVAATIQGQSRGWQIMGVRRLPEEQNVWLELLCLELPGL